MQAQTRSLDSLTNLLDQLKLTLPSLPGFRSLSLFGSVAEGRADEYSDLDLIVTTDDLPQAKLCLLGLLENEIGPIEFCLVMELRSDEWNPTVVFRDHGYYHKLDIGLVAADAIDRTIPAEQTTTLIESPQSHAAAPIAPTAAYKPEPGSVGHFLLGQLLGGSRYLKARRRGHTVTCYRFAAAAADWCARALYDRLTGVSDLSRKLSTDEYKALDGLAATDERSAFLESLDFSSPTAMDQAMHSLLCQLSDHAQALALSTCEHLRGDVVQRVLDFVREEAGQPIATDQ